VSATLHRVGGRLCLDFANTSSGRGGERQRDHLTSYEALLAWALDAGSLDTAGAAALRALAAAVHGEALRVLAEATALREAIYRIFAALAAGKPAPAADLAALNAWLARAMSEARIVATGKGFGWGWAASRSLDGLLWPIVRSAAETLAGTPQGRIRQCPGENCGWLFLDTSKGGRRRWCDMSTCGNRSKARRHYRRRRGAAATP
jgi:predicted RNA-binding Zn ribbon-like protein